MTSHSKKPPPTSRTSNIEVQARSQKLGQQLQSLYKEVAEEPVPDDFLKLLEEADEKARSEDEDVQ